MLNALVTTLATATSDYDYYYNSSPSTLTSSDVGAFWMVFWVIMIPTLIVGILMLVSMWKIFTKAGKPGWAAIVPIYNYIVLLEIVGRPTWWVFLFLLGFIPWVGFIPLMIVSVITTNDLAKSFGKDVGYTLLLLFVGVVGYPMLAFGKAKYMGPAAMQHPQHHAGPTHTPQAPAA